MNRRFTISALLIALASMVSLILFVGEPDPRNEVPAGRAEVVFWHFWGGADRAVVDQVVDRFNQIQTRYFVRGIAMPGNNLDLKLFLAITGGDPPDLINQDDPIMADWAERGALIPLDEFASKVEIEQLEQWLVPAAKRLGTYQGRMYALCNGLDIRALFFNRSLLDQYGLDPPKTLAELDWIAEQTTVRDAQGRYTRIGYLPDPRRLWAWGVVFGGAFYDQPHDQVTVNDPRIVAALNWMTSYRRRYGAVEAAAFRQGDQSLPGKAFPLLAGRYALVMDGQWRVRDIVAAQKEQVRRGEAITQYGVCPLPPPDGGRTDAGWVNGNFFLVPRGAKNAAGAWEFMRFWSGFGGYESEAARTCVSGGWIPVSSRVAEQPVFTKYMHEQPLFAEFVRLSSAEHQLPTPVIPGAPFIQHTIQSAAQQAMYEQNAPAPARLLDEASRSIEMALQRKERDP